MKKTRISITLALVTILALTCLGSINFANASSENYLSYIYPKDDPSQFHSCFDVPDEPNTAKIENIAEMAGPPNNNYAHLYTEVCRSDNQLANNENPATDTPNDHNDDSDETFIVGHFNTPQSGQLWMLCKSEVGVNSYVQVCGAAAASTPQEQNWVWLPALTVTWNEPRWVYIGTFNFDVSDLAVTCYSFPWVPGTNPHEPISALNSLFVDAVEIGLDLSPPSFYLPPWGVPVQFNIVDTNGYPIAGEIYLDGYLIGYTSTTIYLMSYYELGRPYQLSVIAYGDYTFQYHYDSYQTSSYDNPADFYVLQPNYVVSVFAPS